MSASQKHDRIPAPSKRQTDILHRLFSVGIWLKGVDGVLEIGGGLLLLLVSTATLNQTIIALTQHELVEDPHDVVATYLRQLTAHTSAGTQLFGSAYLIFHGLIKVGLVAGLWRKARWAYPAAIGFLVVFIVYQLYRLSYHYSLELALLTLFDIAIISLTWREYRTQQPS